MAFVIGNYFQEIKISAPDYNSSFKFHIKGLLIHRVIFGNVQRYGYSAWQYMNSVSKGKWSMK